MFRREWTVFILGALSLIALIIIFPQVFLEEELSNTHTQEVFVLDKWWEVDSMWVEMRLRPSYTIGGSSVQADAKFSTDITCRNTAIGRELPVEIPRCEPPDPNPNEHAYGYARSEVRLAVIVSEGPDESPRGLLVITRDVWDRLELHEYHDIVIYDDHLVYKVDP